MVDMDYLIDGLTELITDERELTPQRMDTWLSIIQDSCKSIEKELPYYNYESQVRITTALRDILSKTQFASTVVYSLFKGYPGLHELFVVESLKMRKMAQLGSLEAFYDVFSTQKIDNSLSEHIMRIFAYSDFILNNDTGLWYEKFRDLPLTIRTVNELRNLLGNNKYEEVLKSIFDIIEYDLQEYLENETFMNEIDRVAGERLEEVLVATDNILEEANRECIQMICVNSNVEEKLHKLRMNIFKYLYRIRSITGGLDDEDIERLSNEYLENVISTCCVSSINRIIEHLLLELRKSMENVKNQPEMSVKILQKVIQLLVIIVEIK